jgi:N-acetylglucosamine kinase-like BadF-type ATPase
MFILVDSGSTKADWVIVQSRTEWKLYKTEGINPSTHSELLNLEDHKLLMNAMQTADNIFFYGAGVVNDMSTSKIKNWLRVAGFTGDISVEEDLMAAARASSGNRQGIICILGTGSNSCVYDGKSIINKIPTLGYIFSDEGGGTHLGKEIIKAFFYNTMPEDEKEIFLQHFKLTKEMLLEKVYRSPGGSKFVASFATFLTVIEGVWKENLLKKVFREFIELRILKYKECTSFPIYFVGSIAYLHQNYLNQVLMEYGLHSSKIIQHPAQNLIEYHLKQPNT